MKSTIKSCTLAIIFSFTACFAFANNGIETEIEKISIIDNVEIKFTVAIDKRMYFESIDYTEDGSYLSFKTLKVVELIQILNSSGELEFQLPVNNKKIHVSLDDFQLGDYTINMKFKGEDTFVSSDMTKK